MEAVYFYSAISGTNGCLSGTLLLRRLYEGSLSDAKPNFDKAIRLYTGRRSPFGGGPEDSRIKLAYVLWQLGEVDAANVLLDEAETALKHAIKKGNESGYQYYLLAQAECTRGNRSEALQWLQEAFNSGLIIIRLVEMDPILGDLRNDQRFKKMTTDFKARVAKMREQMGNNDR